MPLTDLGAHPHAPAQASELGRSLTALHVTSDRVYAGYGDTFNNTGPIQVRRFNPSDGTWGTFVLQAQTERVGRFRQIGSELWSTNDDPQGSSAEPGFCKLTGTASNFAMMGTVANLLTANQSDFGVDTTGWTADSDTTIAKVTTTKAKMRVTRITSTGSAGANTLAGTSGIPVGGNQIVSGRARVTGDATTRSYFVRLWWYDSAGAFISVSNGPTVSIAANTTTVLTTSPLSPANAARSRVSVYGTNMAVNAFYDVDNVSIHRYAFSEWVLGGTTGPANWRPVHLYDLCERVAGGDIYAVGAIAVTGGSGMLRSQDNGDTWTLAVDAADFTTGAERFYNCGALNGTVYTVQGSTLNPGLASESYVYDVGEQSYTWDGATLTRGPMLDGFIKPLNFAAALVYRSEDGRLLSFDGSTVTQRRAGTCVDHYVDGATLYVLRNGKLESTTDLVTWVEVGFVNIDATSLAVLNGVPYFGTSDSHLWTGVSDEPPPIPPPPPIITSYTADEVLRSDHRIVSRVDVLRNGVVVRSGLPCIGGTVEVDGSADTRRRLSGLTVIDEDAPLKATDLLAPYGTELAVYRGIVLNDVETYYPVGVFRLDQSDTEVSSDGVSAGLVGRDRSATVSAASLEDTLSLPAGTDYGTAIDNVLTTALPSVELAFVSVTHLTPLLVYETGDDPWEIAQEMAKSIGMELFFDPPGRAVLRPVPGADGSPVASYVHGEAGAFIRLSAALDGDSLRNRWIRISSNKAPPFRGVATDDTPGPTAYGGTAGKRTDVERSDLYESQAQAQAAADGAKAANQGATEQASITCLVDPRRDAGDIIRIAHPPRDYEAFAVIDRVTIPLDAGSEMQITCKARRLG